MNELKPDREQQYDKLAAKFHDLFQAGHEKGRAAMETALEKAREQLTAAGEFSAERGQLLKEYLKRDLEVVAEHAKVWGDGAKEHLHPARLGAGALSSLASLLHAAGDTFVTLSRKADEAITYTSGEITSAGTLTCTNCGATIQLKETGAVPLCNECTGTTFKKGY